MALLLLIAGCQNGYQDFYHPTYPNPAQAPPLVPLTEGALPQTVGSDDVDRDVFALLSQNYAVIGISWFNGGRENPRNALAQARRVGATMIVTGSRYTHTLTKTSTLSPENGGPYPSKIVPASTTYQDGMETIPIFPQTQVRYDQKAVYLAKRQKLPRFGMFLRDMTPELRAELKVDSGALVTVVVEGSPAFNAGVLPVDVLIAIGGLSVISAEQGSDLMRQFDSAATRASLSILRKGEAKTLEIDIPPA